MRKTAWEKRGIVEQNQNQEPENIAAQRHESLNAYENSEMELFFELQQVINSGIDSYDHDKLEALIDNTASSFAYAARLVREASVDPDVAREQLAIFWEATDRHRFEFLNDVLGSVEFPDTEDDLYACILEDLYEESDSYEQLNQNIMEKFRVYLRTDANVVLGLICNEVSEDDEEPYGLYEQGPDVLELVNDLEYIAGSFDEEYRTGQKEDFTIIKKGTEKGSPLTTSFLLSAQREYEVGAEGEEVMETTYTISARNKFIIGGFNELPEYVQEFLLNLAEEDEHVTFTPDDLTNGVSIFSAVFEHEVIINSSGTFSSVPDMCLFMDKEMLPIPPDNGGVTPTSVSPEGQEAEATPEEQEFLDSIFTETELRDITASAEEVLESLEREDILETFRQDMGEIATASREYKVAIAKDMADEFKRTIKH